MNKPPRQLKKQIEIIEEIIGNLGDLIDVNKINVQYYGKDFLEPLAEIRQDGLALRSKLEIFKNNLEYALTSQYSKNERFASSSNVIDAFLSKSDR